MSSLAIPPESTSERTSSFVKKGLPSVALVEPLRRGSSEIFGAADERLEERAVLRGRERPERERREARVAAEALEHPGRADGALSTSV